MTSEVHQLISPSHQVFAGELGKAGLKRWYEPCHVHMPAVELSPNITTQGEAQRLIQVGRSLARALGTEAKTHIGYTYSPTHILIMSHETTLDLKG